MIHSDNSNVVKLNFSKPTELVIARQMGMIGVWQGKQNPYAAGSQLWKAWNAGRTSVATNAPGLSKEFASWNPVECTGKLWAELGLGNLEWVK